MPTRPEDYTVGWICAIPTEYVVACELLDQEFGNHETPNINTQDSNLYTFGRIHEHNVVIVCLPKGRYGVTPAALVAERMYTSFPSLRFGLMVGIAGGAPSRKNDIRLGDVVISAPTPKHGGVIQYDFGKAVQNHEFEETGHLNSPPEVLLNALAKIETKHKRKGHRIAETVAGMIDNNELLRAEYNRPDEKYDRLYETSYSHIEQGTCDCQKADNPKSQSGKIKQIDTSERVGIQGSETSVNLEVARGERRGIKNNPVLHYGLIASANKLMKDAIARDAVIKKHDVLCFEMEAAGLMNGFPCVVIRGICDYSDTHKNDAWQGYAAATAAAYAKELLKIIPGANVKSMMSIKDAGRCYQGYNCPCPDPD